MAKTSKNKVKAWRRSSPGNHQGRLLKQFSSQFNSQARGLLPIHTAMFHRAGILTTHQNTSTDN